MCILFFYEFLQSKSSSKINQDETNLFQIYWICCFWYLEINIKKSSSEMMILKWCWIILSPWNCNPFWFGAFSTLTVLRSELLVIWNWTWRVEPFWKVNHLSFKPLFLGSRCYFSGVYQFICNFNPKYSEFEQNIAVCVFPASCASSKTRVARRSTRLSLKNTGCRIASGPD